MLNLDLFETFDVSKLTPQQALRIKRIDAAAKVFATVIDENAPGSAERTVAVRLALDAKTAAVRAVVFGEHGFYRRHVDRDVLQAPEPGPLMPPGVPVCLSRERAELGEHEAMIVEGSVRVDSDCGLVASLAFAGGAATMRDVTLVPWVSGDYRISEEAMRDLARRCTRDATRVRFTTREGTSVAITSDSDAMNGVLSGFTIAPLPSPVQ